MISSIAKQTKGSQMGILFESSTHIEYLLRDALVKEGIEFQEQYRIYSGGKFSEVKFVADFLVTNATCRVIVECDGFHYHAGKDKYRKQILRDEWLTNHGYTVLHFSTNLLKYNMPEVIQTIRLNLNLPYDETKIISMQSTSFKPLHNKTPTKKRVETFDTILFCYYKQMPTGICATYRYKSVTYNKWSEERTKICKNVPEGMLEPTAIYMALLDLKRPVHLQLYYSGTVYHDNYDVSKKLKKSIRQLAKGAELLNQHNISTSYVAFNGNYRFSKKEPQQIMNQLRSRCRQISNNENIANVCPTFDFNDFTFRQ